MIAKSYIVKNLRQIEQLFNKSTSIQNGLFYSKLSIIELCGWIEMSMDDIVLRLARKRLRNASYQKHIQKVVKRTYGFEYDYHFLGMLEGVIGRHGIEQMNKKVDFALITPLVAALSSLKTARDQLAHQYVKGTTLVIDAPSVTNARFPIVLAGLQDIEKVLLEK